MLQSHGSARVAEVDLHEANEIYELRLILLLRLATMLSDRAGLMVTVGLPDRPAGYNTAAAHRTLADLALAGDATGAAQELRRHLSTTRAALHMVLTGPARSEAD